MEPTGDPLRLLWAAGLVAAYAGLCLAMARAWRRKRQAAVALEPAAGDSPLWLVAYASQTGTAESLAWHTAETLHLAGVAAHLCSLAELDDDALLRAERLLLVASTCGEGDAPDNGAAFVRRLLAAETPLGHLHYGLLALGDRSYANFCGFGRRLHRLLQDRGAQPLFEPIEADRCAPAALEAWKQHLSHLAGTGDVPDWEGPAFADWRLAERRLLNSGSAGGPVYHLELEPPDGMPLPAWKSGDLVQVLPPDDPACPRDYSVASVPSPPFRRMAASTSWSAARPGPTAARESLRPG